VKPKDINADGVTDDTPGKVLGDGVISEAQANAILDEWEGCADLDRLFAQSTATEFVLDADGVQCVADGLHEADLTRQAFLPSFTTDSDDIPPELVTDLIGVVEGCSSAGSGDSAIVDAIAESLAGPNITTEQARCLAQAMIDDLGLDRLVELGLQSGDFDTASAEAQNEIVQATLDAATSCDVPLSALGE
jgi:hypothetical protein